MRKMELTNEQNEAIEALAEQCAREWLDQTPQADWYKLTPSCEGGDWECYQKEVKARGIDLDGELEAFDVWVKTQAYVYAQALAEVDHSTYVDVYVRTSAVLGLHFVTDADGRLLGRFRQLGAFAKAACARQLGVARRRVLFCYL